MFTTTREKLVATLLRLRAQVCCYENDPCDCKYGRGEITAQGMARKSTESTGCPELAQAVLMLSALSDDEFLRLTGAARDLTSKRLRELMKQHREVEREGRRIAGAVPDPVSVEDGSRKHDSKTAKELVDTSLRMSEMLSFTRSAAKALEHERDELKADLTKARGVAKALEYERDGARAECSRLRQERDAARAASNTPVQDGAREAAVQALLEHASDTMYGHDSPETYCRSCGWSDRRDERVNGALSHKPGCALRAAIDFFKTDTKAPASDVAARVPAGACVDVSRAAAMEEAARICDDAAKSFDQDPARDLARIRREVALMIGTRIRAVAGVPATPIPLGAMSMVDPATTKIHVAYFGRLTVSRDAMEDGEKYLGVDVLEAAVLPAVKRDAQALLRNMNERGADSGALRFEITVQDAHPRAPKAAPPSKCRGCDDVTCLDCHERETKTVSFEDAKRLFGEDRPGIIVDANTDAPIEFARTTIGICDAHTTAFPTAKRLHPLLHSTCIACGDAGFSYSIPVSQPTPGAVSPFGYMRPGGGGILHGDVPIDAVPEIVRDGGLIESVKPASTPTPAPAPTPAATTRWALCATNGHWPGVTFRDPAKGDPPSDTGGFFSRDMVPKLMVHIVDPRPRSSIPVCGARHHTPARPGDFPQGAAGAVVCAACFLAAQVPQ